MKRIEIERLLPSIFQRTILPGTPLYSLCEVMEGLHAPTEKFLETLDTTFDPRRTQEDFVPYLARWLDLERLYEKRGETQKVLFSKGEPISTGLGRLRELIAAAAYLSQWRGTAKGLLFFLQIATGEHAFEINEQVRENKGGHKVFHICVSAPAPTAPHRPLIERIIESEKPAYVTYELIFKPPSKN